MDRKSGIIDRKGGANTKKRTLLDEFSEMDEMFGKKAMTDICDSESDTNTLNAETESVSRITNASARLPECEFGDDVSLPSRRSTQAVSKSNTNTNTRNHAPQLIDEDTEHFKVKIEHLLNLFKTDAISEFMGMKRSMLEDQRS